MKESKRPVNFHQAYHAHVYFEKETLEFASSLCKKAGESFDLMGWAYRQKVHLSSLTPLQIKQWG